jgi:hypothetical protein
MAAAAAQKQREDRLIEEQIRQLRARRAAQARAAAGPAAPGSKP